MRTAIDRSGRIVVPKVIRDRLSLRGGEELEILERDGVIELWPAPMDIEFVETPEGVVAMAKRPVPLLTADVVRDTLEKIRR
ncbi:MAG TPA: AbrB/MazE/SpoVT family DNA-binding domain-containing protein [Acidimicrobiia bacterium]|nr:AbrB/MazE/SpoVT family DNA-binding domain-containing protein [Acidimicrobiia bacterium]